MDQILYSGAKEWLALTAEHLILSGLQDVFWPNRQILPGASKYLIEVRCSLGMLGASTAFVSHLVIHLTFCCCCTVCVAGKRRGGR